MPSAVLSARLRRFAPLLAAAPLCLACVAAGLPGSPRDAVSHDRSPLGTSGHVAANPAVPGGRHIHAPFRLTNTGDEPLTVTAVQPDCGCLTPLLNRDLFDPADPTVIEPGGFAELIVRADTAREAEGPHEHEVKVVCTDPAGAAVEQTVKLRYGVGPHEIRIEPPAVMIYQREGQTTTATVTVTDRRTAPLKILGANSPTDRVGVTPLDPVAREDGGWDFPFEVTVVGCEDGGNEVAVAVEVDDPNGRYRLLKLPVTVQSPDRLLNTAMKRISDAESRESAGDTDGERASR
ncbi:DUF1573 domain-containing protein [Alienimonas chondri]|uniref:DUF1573 domain-containing protein n=1 Tax=Alienimonas chondri TaxID=2681879 RepID=A0ABX1VD78_9PLAN|nr:DUF1573 domain-containing protein [Alienimonas chondri]NNJ25852.1 hypothetical protein [Alienimonas chondri]